MNVKELAIQDIKVSDRYRKEYGDVEALAANIKDKGLIQPITVDQEYNLLAGGRRLAACKQLEYTHIPCVIRNTEGAIDKLEIELFENIFRKDLHWTEKLAIEKRIYSLRGRSGLTQQEIADQMGVSVATVNRDLKIADAIEAVPELAKYERPLDAVKAFERIQEGLAVKELAKRAEHTKEVDHPTEASTDLEVFRWAENHYNVGDAFTGMQEIDNGVFGFAEVDPPYGIDLHAAKRQSSEGIGTDTNLKTYQEVHTEAYKDWLYDMASEVYRITEQRAFTVWWFGMSNHALVKGCLEHVGFTVCDIPGIWYKGNTGQTQQPDYNLANSYETFFVCRKGNYGTLARRGRSNVFHFASVPGQDKIHSTERPVELMEEILSVFCFPGCNIVSPFLGSGSVLRAAYKLGHAGIGWDVAEEHRNRFLLKVAEDFKAKEKEDNESND